MLQFIIDKAVSDELKDRLKTIKIDYNKKYGDESLYLVSNETYCRVKDVVYKRDNKVLPLAAVHGDGISDIYNFKQVVILNLTTKDIIIDGVEFKPFTNKNEGMNTVINHVDKTYWGILEHSEYLELPIKYKKYFLSNLFFTTN